MRSNFFVTGLLLILAFAFVTRLDRLEKPNRYIFDEVYHAVTAKLIAHNDPRAYEWWHSAPEPNTAIDWLHPPLAKYTQALSLRVLGENSFGWRLSSAITGVLVIALTAIVARNLFDSDRIGLLAGGLASLDGLLLVQSRIAMNDIHVTMAILLAVACYWKRLTTNKAWPWLWLAGLSAGLAMSSKWSGVFILAPLGLWELVGILWQLKTATWKKTVIKFFMAGVALFVLPILVYVLSYGHMFIQGKTLFRCPSLKQELGKCYPITLYRPHTNKESVLYSGYTSHFGELHRQIWMYQTTLDATHPYQSRPWQWFFNLRPVWYHVDYETGEADTIANIYAFGNTLLFWLAGLAAVVSIGWLIWESDGKKWWRKYRPSEPAGRLLFISVVYWTVWLPWVLSPRIMFFYHYTPAVPFLAIQLAFWLEKIQKPRLTQVVVLLIFLTFLLWYPQWTGIPRTKNMDGLYYALPSWK